MRASTGGGPWEEVFEQRDCQELPAKVRVGVVAESSDEGAFRAEFSRFRLMTLDPDGR